jgi:hypothetical protein
MFAPVRLVALFVVGFALAGAGTAGAYHTHFVANNCNYSAPTPMSYITRDSSTTSALKARYEGYQWGGGCWNDNDRDDSPGDPVKAEATGGEGPDCSGFAFKIWRESNSTSNDGYYLWAALRYEHGPYDAAAFKAAAGAPNIWLAKSSAIRMDALASTDHIGLVYATNADGSDQIIEAKGEAYGTNIWMRTYRGNSSYSGVRRTGWSSSTTPQ